MYITGMSTEHCTIFSVISGLHDFTADYYCTQPRRHCSPTPKSTGLLPRTYNVKKLCLVHFRMSRCSFYCPTHWLPRETTNSLMEVVADKPLM